MTISNLNLFATLAMVITCIVGIALNPPELHFHRFNRLQTVGGSLADALRRQSSHADVPDYSIRHVTQDADGTNQYYRFTISRIGSGYRAYIDSVPRLGVPLEQIGVYCDRGRYYIDAGKWSTATDAENAAKNWANTQSSTARIDPV